MTSYGYARVSTAEQSLDAQLEQLKAAGCTRIFREKASGVRSDRAQLLRMLDGLQSGDIVTVCRLDRLARSTRDLLNMLDRISKRGCSFKSLGDAWADTSTPHGRLMVTVLGGLAEFERDLIRARTSEGRKRALVNGVRFGRKPKLTAHQREIVRSRRLAGETCRTIGLSLNVSPATVSRIS